MTERRKHNGLFSFHDFVFALSINGTTVDGGRLGVSVAMDAKQFQTDLPASEFLMLSLLMLQSQTARRNKQPDSAAYVSKAALYAQMKRLLGAGDAACVTKTVFKLRHRLRKALPADWRHLFYSPLETFIETSMLGYRISVPPENLTVVLLDADRIASTR